MISPLHVYMTSRYFTTVEHGSVKKALVAGIVHSDFHSHSDLTKVSDVASIHVLWSTVLQSGCPSIRPQLALTICIDLPDPQ